VDADAENCYKTNTTTTAHRKLAYLTTCRSQHTLCSRV